MEYLGTGWFIYINIIHMLLLSAVTIFSVFLTSHVISGLDVNNIQIIHLTGPTVFTCRQCCIPQAHVSISSNYPDTPVACYGYSAWDPSWVWAGGGGGMGNHTVRTVLEQQVAPPGGTLGN